MHRPTSRDQVASVVTSEIASLEESDLAALFPFVVALEPFTTESGPGSDGRSYWMVARDGDQVLYWDAVEEEFATGELKGQVLQDIVSCGENLEWGLRHFLEKSSANKSRPPS